MKKGLPFGSPLIESGDVLLFHLAIKAVLSAMRSLTAVFGMFTGGSFSLFSPEIAEFTHSSTLTTAYIYSF